jgi:hypothetical protein
MPVYVKTPSELSGGLVVKHPALGAKDYRFDPSNRSKPFQINFLAHNIVGGCLR